MKYLFIVCIIACSFQSFSQVKHGISLGIDVIDVNADAQTYDWEYRGAGRLAYHLDKNVYGNLACNFNVGIHYYTMKQTYSWEEYKDYEIVYDSDFSFSAEGNLSHPITKKIDGLMGYRYRRNVSNIAYAKDHHLINFALDYKMKMGKFRLAYLQPIKRTRYTEIYKYMDQFDAYKLSGASNKIRFFEFGYILYFN